MSDEHTHDDCVQCLQKEVRRLKAELDDANTQIEVRDEAYKSLHTEYLKTGSAERSNVLAYLRNLDAAQAPNGATADGARFAIRQALTDITNGKHEPGF